ncbi:tail protein [Erwinia phage Faunus]|uniref:Dit-like phage tail protein N-terminal domain-containing protein n=1 Tax=Erwinia phage Faunus TaxID=2182346 RepID=A0A2U8UWV4_9CAUD|nr:tail protein [Erwinia phage Faunus]AWN08648.1 hypothetical protein [Erwinia phage Faunus]
MAFHYGHHPSIIMWSNGEVVQKQENTFGSIAQALESIPTTGSVPESFNSFKFDAIVSEGHVAEATITKFPVSSGFLVSDHVINHNRVLKLEAVATNMQNAAMWTASIQGISVLTGAVFNNPIIPIVGGAVGLVASAFETENRMQSTWELFNGFRVNGTKLYISTILGPYLNCVVTSVKSKQDKMTSHMLAIEITLEELQVIGPDANAATARTAMESMYDYSNFAKLAQSIGIGVLGGAPLPGLGVFGDTPTDQLNTLKDKLSKITSPVDSVKGLLA